MKELYPSGLEKRKGEDSESEEENDENDPDVRQAWDKRRFDIFYDRKVKSAAGYRDGDESHPWIKKIHKKDGPGGVDEAISKPAMFRAARTKGKGKDQFICAYGQKCLNRCPRLRARIEC